MTGNEGNNQQGADVDQQDGGPASHTESGTGGSQNDVASGGSSDDNVQQDVLGDKDTVD